jgi:pyruvate formate lyase activating enzyme
MLREAALYDKFEDQKVHCFLCSHHCKIPPGKYGICGVRENRSGSLYTHAYGELIGDHIDPIEKKPLYHFLPGSTSYSIAAIGCNFRCGFCQNWQISQAKEARHLGLQPHPATPEEIVEGARRSGSKSISYTYTEPTIFFEYAYEIAQRAKEKGLRNVFVTNGFMTNQMIEMIHPYLDAANIDLKSFREDYYRDICKARLQPVLENIEKMKKLGTWIEVTTLVVPGQNDSDDELGQIASFLAGIDPAVPWHISRFHPQYRMEDLNPTPLQVLKRAYEIGREKGLRYVYLGNVGDHGNTTYCYQCSTPLIERSGFSVREFRMKDGRCPHCGSTLDGVGL